VTHFRMRSSPPFCSVVGVTPVFTVYDGSCFSRILQANPSSSFEFCPPLYAQRFFFSLCVFSSQSFRVGEVFFQLLSLQRTVLICGFFDESYTISAVWASWVAHSYHPPSFLLGASPLFPVIFLMASQSRPGITFALECSRGRRSGPLSVVAPEIVLRNFQDGSPESQSTSFNLEVPPIPTFVPL